MMNIFYQQEEYPEYLLLLASEEGREMALKNPSKSSTENALGSSAIIPADLGLVAGTLLAKGFSLMQVLICLPVVLGPENLSEIDILKDFLLALSTSMATTTIPPELEADVARLKKSSQNVITSLTDASSEFLSKYPELAMLTDTAESRSTKVVESVKTLVAISNEDMPARKKKQLIEDSINQLQELIKTL